MLNSLYIKAASKRGSIKEIIPELEGNSIVSDNWNEKTLRAVMMNFQLALAMAVSIKRNF